MFQVDKCSSEQSGIEEGGEVKNKGNVNYRAKTRKQDGTDMAGVS